MTAQPNSLERFKLYYEYVEDDVMHDLLVKRANAGTELKRLRTHLKKLYALFVIRKRVKVPDVSPD